MIVRNATEITKRLTISQRNNIEYLCIYRLPNVIVIVFYLLYRLISGNAKSWIGNIDHLYPEKHNIHVNNNGVMITKIDAQNTRRIFREIKTITKTLTFHRYRSRDQTSNRLVGAFNYLNTNNELIIYTIPAAVLCLLWHVYRWENNLWNRDSLRLLAKNKIKKLQYLLFS